MLAHNTEQQLLEWWQMMFWYETRGSQLLAVRMVLRLRSKKTDVKGRKTDSWTKLTKQGAIYENRLQKKGTVEKYKGWPKTFVSVIYRVSVPWTVQAH